MEQEANEEADEHNKRLRIAKDEATKKDARDAEDRARLRARGRSCMLPSNNTPGG